MNKHRISVICQKINLKILQGMKRGYGQFQKNSQYIKENYKCKFNLADSNDSLI
jgi:hypothetical protein